MQDRLCFNSIFFLKVTLKFPPGFIVYFSDFRAAQGQTNDFCSHLLSLVLSLTAPLLSLLHSTDMPRMFLTEPSLIAAAQARQEPGPYAAFVMNVSRIERKQPKAEATHPKQKLDF